MTIETLRPKPRTVFFDVDGVLVHGYHARPDLQQRWDENLLEDLGVDPGRFRDEFIYGIFIKKVIVGQIPLIAALDKVLPGLGYNGSSMTFVHYWLTHDSKLNTELLDSIKTLTVSASPKLYIATNQEHMRAQWLWQTLRLNETFADIFYSARLGVKKPDPAFFKEVARRVGPFDEAPLFFDDRPDVVEAATRSGWEAVLFETVEDFNSHPWIAARIGG